MHHHWQGEIPPELAILTRLELSMLSLVNCITTITLRPPKPKNQPGGIGNPLSYWASVKHKGKSKVFSVVNDAPELMRQLPRMPTRDSFAIFVNKNCKAPEDMTFRPERVRAAFEWLKQHNHLYREAEFHVDAMDACVEDVSASAAAGESVRSPPVVEVDEDEAKEIDQVLTSASSADAEHTASDSDIFLQVEDNPLSRIDHLRTMITGSDDTACVNTNAAVPTPQMVRQQTTPAFVHPQNHPYFYEKAYPALFPYGVGGPGDNKNSDDAKHAQSER